MLNHVIAFCIACAVIACAEGSSDSALIHSGTLQEKSEKPVYDFGTAHVWKAGPSGTQNGIHSMDDTSQCDKINSQYRRACKEIIRDGHSFVFSVVRMSHTNNGQDEIEPVGYSYYYINHSLPKNDPPVSNDNLENCTCRALSQAAEAHERLSYAAVTTAAIATFWTILGAIVLLK